MGFWCRALLLLGRRRITTPSLARLALHPNFQAFALILSLGAWLSSQNPVAFAEKIKSLKRLKWRGFGLKFPERRLVGFPILGSQVIDEEDAVKVIMLVLGGA